MDHPIITFKPRIAPMAPPKSTQGRLIGDYLVVSYATADIQVQQYTIYNTAGRRLFQAIFLNMSEAIAFAEWLNERFGEYFPIWEEYPDADVFGWARYSVPHGEQIHNNLTKQYKLRA
jgi:hypothetical protein